MKISRIVSLVLAALLLFSLCACSRKAETPAAAEPAAEPAVREYADDTGRTVTLPAQIEKIAISGPLTQIYIISIAPDMMVGSANYFSSNAEKYLSPELLALPQLGQLYGGKGTMDLEALLAADPDIVLDVGEAKGNIAEDLDNLTEQTGIPFVHIDATIETAPEAYRKLGDLLGKQEKGEEIASYLEGVIAEISDIMAKVDADGARKNIVYCLGDKGLNVLADGSFHADTLKLVANNIAKVDDVTSSGDGNEVDMEQLMLWNPDAVIFAPESVYSQVGDDPRWQNLDAIKNGEYYETPLGPYGWLQSPPAVQRYLGLSWLACILYPDYCTYDLQQKVTEYYNIFYGYELSDADYQALTANSLG